MSEKFGFDSTAEEVSEGVDLTGQTWLVTGCNSGLGYETARVLALRGARIVGAARTEAKASDALGRLGVEGTPVACELSDLDTVRGAVERISQGAPLDGIVANAGIMALQSLEQVHGYERQFFTNHVGHFTLITGLLDRLTDSARLVIVSSGAHRFAERGLEFDNLSGETDYDPWRMYGRSKLANILFANGLAKRFAGSGRTANSLHPGVIETNLARHIPDAESMFARMRPTMKTVPQGAATQCYLAMNPEVGGVTGKYFSDCAPAETRPEADDDALIDELWTRTEAIIADV